MTTSLDTQKKEKRKEKNNFVQIRQEMNILVSFRLKKHLGMFRQETYLVWVGQKEHLVRFDH